MWLSRAGGGQPTRTQRNFLQNPPARNATFTARHQHSTTSPGHHRLKLPVPGRLLLVAGESGKIVAFTGRLTADCWHCWQAAWALYTFTIK